MYLSHNWARKALAATATGMVAASASLAMATPADAAPWKGKVQDYGTTYHLGPSETQNNLTQDCPANMWLVDEHKAGARTLPEGIWVAAPFWVGVAGVAHVGGGETFGRVVGVRGLSLSNWTTEPQTAVVYLTCSDNIDDGFNY